VHWEREGQGVRSLLEQSQLLHSLHKHVQQDQLQLAIDQTRAEFAQYSMVETGIGQLQAKRVLPVNSAPNRIGRLTVGQSFAELEDRG
jgi:myo-inositol-hexaphosphate 3-phosphohydrolase